MKKGVVKIAYITEMAIGFGLKRVTVTLERKHFVEVDNEGFRCRG